MDELEKVPTEEHLSEIAELSPAQYKALRALLTSTTIDEAAREAGLSRDTVHRYLQDRTFARIYREQRMFVLMETTTALQRAGAHAVEVMETAMGEDVEDMNTRLRAARSIVDMLFKGAEIERKLIEMREFEERLQALERLAIQNNRNRGYFG